MPLHESTATAANAEPFKFKARPVNAKVMQSAGDLGVPRVVKRAPTQVSEFKLSASRPSTKAAPSAEAEKPVYSSFGSAMSNANASKHSLSAAPEKSKPTAPPPTRVKEFSFTSRPASARSTRKVEAADEMSRPLYSSFGAPAATPRSMPRSTLPAATPRSAAPTVARGVVPSSTPVATEREEEKGVAYRADEQKRKEAKPKEVNKVTTKAATAEMMAIAKPKTMGVATADKTDAEVDSKETSVADAAEERLEVAHTEQKTQPLAMVEPVSGGTVEVTDAVDVSDAVDASNAVDVSDAAVDVSDAAVDVSDMTPMRGPPTISHGSMASLVEHTGSTPTIVPLLGE